MNWLVGYVSGISASVVSAVLAGFILKTINRDAALLSLCIGLIVFISVVIRYKNLSFNFKRSDFNFWTLFVIISFSIISLRAFLWLIYKTGDSIKILSPNNLGDISLHISLIKYLSNSPRWWPENNIVANEIIRYPVGMDLFNSLLIFCGFDLFKSLIWVGLLGAAITCLCLLLWGGSFTLAGFLFNGGFAGFQFFSLLVFKDYQINLAWKNIFLTMFITQRGLLYAIPVGLLLLTSWRQRFFSDDKANDSKFILPLWIEVLLYSSMPIFHAHTFIILSLFLFIWLLFVSWKSRSHIIKMFIFSLPFALFLLSLMINPSKASSMIHLKLGWMQNKENFLSFWLYNFGIFWPLVLLLGLELPGIPGLMKFNLQEVKERFKKDRIIVISAIFLFILFLNVMAAPWEWDNCKILIWPYLILLPYIWKSLISAWDDHYKYITCFLLFFSGFICVFGGFPEIRGYGLTKFSEVAQVEKAVKNLPIEGRFAAFPTFDHPLLYCGKKIVMGYPGWMWSHGYNTKTLEKKLKKLMLGDEKWEKYAGDLSVRYIFFGKRELKEYSESKKPWEEHATKIASGNWGEIYDLQEQGEINPGKAFQEIK